MYPKLLKILFVIKKRQTRHRVYLLILVKLSLVFRTEEADFILNSFLNVFNLEVADAKIIKAFFDAFFHCCVTCKKKIGEDVHLCNAITNGVSKVVVGKTGTTVENEGSVNSCANIAETL